MQISVTEAENLEMLRGFVSKEDFLDVVRETDVCTWKQERK